MLTLLCETEERDKQGKRIGIYRCDCGDIKKRLICEVNRGEAGCRCYRRIFNCTRLTRDSYRAMIFRCYNKNHSQYKDYGGRGIKVCERWLESPDNFIKDMGERPGKNYSIDRIDNDKDYEPNNCKWSTRKEQANNRKNNIKVSYNGNEYTVSELAYLVGIKPNVLAQRLKRMSVEEAVNKPVISKPRIKTNSNR